MTKRKEQPKPPPPFATNIVDNKARSASMATPNKKVGKYASLPLSKTEYVDWQKWMKERMRLTFVERERVEAAYLRKHHISIGSDEIYCFFPAEIYQTIQLPEIPENIQRIINKAERKDK